MRPRSRVQPLKRQLLQSIPCWRTAPLNSHRFTRNPEMRGLGWEWETDGGVQRLITLIQIPWEGTEPSSPWVGPSPGARGRLQKRLTSRLTSALLCSLSCVRLCNPMDCSPPGSSVHGDSPGKSSGGGCHALLLGDLPNPGIKPRSPTFQADSLPLGKPKNTGVGSLSLLQRIFLTQESNQGLLHCRQILYQLSNQGSPSRGGLKACIWSYTIRAPCSRSA